MSETHHHASEHNHKHKQQEFSWKHIHRDWRLWVGVALMLAAMFAYLASDDESLVPGQAPTAPMPAAAGP